MLHYPGIISFLVFVGLHFTAHSQNLRMQHEMQMREKDIARTSVHFEIGGNALGWSINGDRILFQSDYYKGSLRLGIGILPYPSSLKDNRTFLFFPVEYNNLFGPKQNFLEIGLGTTFTNSLQGSDIWITGRVGYRLQPIGGGFFMRAGLVLLYIPYTNPILYGNETMDIVLPLPSVSWGFSF
ncbi:MAG: hypothetical protein EA392_09420 [Cryomorphaceae bacterium]|nr:MAG: hypothetical protein EA392_09420 [Cryomorphaceae bacterium]